MFSSTGSNHPIIPRKNDLLITPHYVTFHSNDRDKTKYPSASQWATRLPQNVNSIRSMHLVDCYIPTKNAHVFKQDYQNLAFMIEIETTTSEPEPEPEPESYCDCNEQEYNKRKDGVKILGSCAPDIKHTPSLNLSRPLIPHSNVKFDADTKDDYVTGPDNNGPYQIPSVQLQNNSTYLTCSIDSSTTTPILLGCPSSKNNQKGLDNMTPCNDNNCDPPAPRSMSDQQSALIRIGHTNPPYITKMRENEELIEKCCPEYDYNTYDNSNPTPSNMYMLRIREGYYTGQELATELQNQLNNLPHTHIKWLVHYSSINCKLYFYCYTTNSTININVKFRFECKINYDCKKFINKDQPLVWNNNDWWGLGYYLGFKKKYYKMSCLDRDSGKSLEETINEMTFNDSWYNNIPPDEQFTGWEEETTRHQLCGLVSCCCANTLGPSVLYMEVVKYNNCDEIYHSSNNTSSTYNNTFSGINNAVFAKLEMDPERSGRGFFKDSVQYITHMKNQLEERINKLEFKFRFHDGRYVVFDCNKDLNFSIQFNCAEENPLSKYTFTAVPGWTT